MKDKLKKISKRKLLLLFSVAVIASLLLTAFPIHIEKGEPDNNVFQIGTGDEVVRITIGNPVAAQVADYTCDGVDDHVQFQAALTALPASGGQLFILTGDYVWGNTQTVTRAIDDVSIIGVGTSVYISGDGVTDLFSAGGNDWLFSNLETDAGGINMGATTDWMWLNVRVSTTKYSLRTADVSIVDGSVDLGNADTTLARASAGDVNIEGNIIYRAGGTDVPLTDGGTGSSTASGARTNLGLAIGSDVQAYDAQLADIAGLAVTDSNFIVGDGVNWVAESGATARTSLGLTIDTDVAAQTHASQHAVSGGDTIFPVDPNADRYLLWDDDPGELVWSEVSGTGDVVGPAASIDHAIVRFDGVTGKLIQDYTSNAPTISDTGDATIDGDLTADNIITAGLVDGIDVSVHDTATTGVHGVGAETILDTGDIGSSIQAWDTELDDIAALSDADSNFIVGSVAGWVAESGATVRTSLGLTIDTDVPSQSSFDDHSARHLVGGADTILPADPDADQYLMWDDAPTGELVWSTPGGGGDVTGPGSSTDNSIVRFHETTGKVIQDYTSNPPTISDTGDMTIDGDATVDNLITAGNVDGVDVSAHVTGDLVDADFNAQTVMLAVSDDTPVATTVTEQTLIGRLTGGNVGLVTIGIADNNILQVDDAGPPASGEYGRFTAAGIEGRSLAEMLGDIGDAAADDSTKGVATFEADDFDSASGKIDLAVSILNQLTGDSGTATATAHTLSITGGSGITTTASGTDVSVAGDDATTSTKGVASFDVQHFSVTSGAVDFNIDDTAVDGETDEPITSNWAYDHDADGSAHQSNVITITFIIDGGGSAIATGEHGHIELPFACTITGWTLLADQSGSIVIDVWKDTYANFPPTVADTIAGSEKPTLSTAQKNQDLTLTTWTTAVTAGDILAFNVDSATTVERITLSVRATKT